MSRINKTIGTALAALLLTSVVLVVALVGIAMRGVSLDPARGLIESIASKALGTSVELAGPITLQLGRVTRVTAAGVSIANTPWAGPEPLLALDNAAVELVTSTLLSSTIRVQSVAVAGLRLDLQYSTEGEANWPDLGSADEGTETTPTQPAALPVLIEEIDLRDIELIYADDSTGQRLALALDTFSQQQAANDQLQLAGNGRLNDDAWQVAGTISSPHAVYADGGLSQELSGTIGSVSFRSNGHIPDISVLKDMTLGVELTGTVPEALAALSPLFQANSEIEATIAVTDVDPGIAINAQLDFDHMTVSLDGIADAPRNLDGLQFTVSAAGKSINRVLTAFGAGEIPDSPFTLGGMVKRNGTDLQVDELRFDFAEHGVRLDGAFSKFPAIDGANVTMRANGPDFSVLQQAASMPVVIDVPYELTAELVDREGAVEFVTSQFLLGKHDFSIEGRMGSFPELDGTEMRVEVSGPSLAELGDAVQVAGLPKQAYALEANIVADDTLGLVVRDLKATSTPLTLTAEGQLGKLPALDNLNVELTLHSTTLSGLGDLVEAEGLGDVPVKLSAALSGQARAPVLDVVDLTLGSSTVTAQGPLQLGGSGIEGALAINAELTDLSQVLGDHFPQGLSPGPYRLDASQTWRDGSIVLQVSELSGPALSGVLEATVREDFSLTGATLDADLRLAKPSALFSVEEGPGLPDTPLRLVIGSNVVDEEVRNKISVLGADDAKIDLVVTMPSSSDMPVKLRFSGAGADLTSLVGTGFVPAGALPFEVQGDVEKLGDEITLNVTTVQVGGSRLAANATYRDGTVPELVADVRIERGELDRWLALREGEADAGAEKASGPNASGGKAAARMIPDIAIDTALLEQYSIDLKLQSGPLGVADFGFPEESLINTLKLHVTAGEGALTLNLAELAGSRGEITGNLALHPLQEKLQAQVSLEGASIPFGMTGAGTSIQTLPMHDLSGEFSASGNTTLAMAKTLEGRLRVQGGKGSVQDIGLGIAMSSFVAQLIDALFPSHTATTDVEIDCTVIALTAAQGVIEFDPGFVMRTKRMDLIAQGKINLANEKIKVRFNNKPREGLGISAAGLINPYVQIVGTLSKPTIGLNATSGAIVGGAAVATGGLSILGTKLYDRFLDSRTPCKDALAKFDQAE